MNGVEFLWQIQCRYFLRSQILAYLGKHRQISFFTEVGLSFAGIDGECLQAAEQRPQGARDCCGLGLLCQSGHLCCLSKT